MLSLTSKLAALYAQETTDAAVLAAVREIEEIEEIAAAVSSKIWQKVMVLNALSSQVRD
ncbi:MAG: hypothetical protein K1X38_00430 [Microthrixaceae bacterium]|nr:hypothetical protein [Microthrixaceae bacterium]